MHWSRFYWLGYSTVAGDLPHLTRMLVTYKHVFFYQVECQFQWRSWELKLTVSLIFFQTLFLIRVPKCFNFHSSPPPTFQGEMDLFRSSFHCQDLSSAGHTNQQWLVDPEAAARFWCLLVSSSSVWLFQSLIVRIPVAMVTWPSRNSQASIKLAQVSKIDQDQQGHQEKFSAMLSMKWRWRWSFESNDALQS